MFGNLDFVGRHVLDGRETYPVTSVHVHIVGMQLPIWIMISSRSRENLRLMMIDGMSRSQAIAMALHHEVSRIRRNEAQREEFLRSLTDPEELLALRESFQFVESIEGPW